MGAMVGSPQVETTLRGKFSSAWMICFVSFKSDYEGKTKVGLQVLYKYCADNLLSM